MRRFITILFFISLSLSATNDDDDDHVSVGWKKRIDPKVAWWFGGGLMVGHLGLNIVSAYFQMQQNTEIEKIPYSDNEVGVAEEDKRCGRLCQLNTDIIRTNSHSTTDLNGVATLCSVVSSGFNIVAISMWISMLAHWEATEDNRLGYKGYVDNIRKFQRIAVGISAFGAILNACATWLMARTVARYREEVPLKTLAPLELATFTARGYWPSMFVFSGMGFVGIGNFIEGLRKAKSASTAESKT